MNLSNRGQSELETDHNKCRCKCIHYNCPECGSMVRTKFVYIYRTVYMLENRACVSVGDSIFRSNKVVAKKIVEHQL